MYCFILPSSRVYTIRERLYSAMVFVSLSYVYHYLPALLFVQVKPWLTKTPHTHEVVGFETLFPVGVGGHHVNNAKKTLWDDVRPCFQASTSALISVLLPF